MSDSELSRRGRWRSSARPTPLLLYTQAIISASPVPDPKTARAEKSSYCGASPINPSGGCRFRPRCPYVIRGKCEKEEPPLVEARRGHHVACHLYA